MNGKHCVRALVRVMALALLVPTAVLAAGGGVSGKVSASPAKHQKNVVVYLEGPGGGAPSKPAVMDQKGMQFVPHVLPIVKGTTVNFLNSDSVRHNVFSPDGEKYNLGTWPVGESRPYTFKKVGVYTQLCNIHPEMEAFVVVLDAPHFAVTGKDGSFVIENVPPGSYQLKVWSAKRKAEAISVTVKAGEKISVNLKLVK